MVNRASVKNIILEWEKGGVDAVKTFLDEAEVYEFTWANKIKKLLDKGLNKSVDAEIRLVYFNMNLERELYKNNENDEKS